MQRILANRLAIPFRSSSVKLQSFRSLHHHHHTSKDNSSEKPSESVSNKRRDRWWTLLAVSLAIPTLGWIYNRHRRRNVDDAFEEDIADDKPVVISDLKQITGQFKSSQPLPASSSSALTSFTESNSINGKFLIVGGGTAGFAAMEELIRLGIPSEDVLIISEENYPPYLRPPLSKELWFNQEEKKIASLNFTDWHGEEKAIFYRPLSSFMTPKSNLNNTQGHLPRLLTGRRAINLDVENKTVQLDDGTIISYEKLLIATGGKPKGLPILQEINHDRVSTFRGINDMKHLVENVLPTATHIAIIGGGFLGSELSVALAQYSKGHLNGRLKVTQLFPEDGNMALVFPRYLSRWTMKKIRAAGITVLPNKTVNSAQHNMGIKSKPLELRLNSTKQSDSSSTSSKEIDKLNVDHAIVAIGIEPEIELALKAGLEIDSERGGIMTNAYLQASPDIYAAGDVISFHDSFLGMRRRVEHYDHAILSARVAAHNMVASSMGRFNFKPKPYSAQSMFWSDLGPEIGYEAVGLIDSQLTTVGVWAEAAREDSPSMAELDPSDIRAQKLGDVIPRKAEVPAMESHEDLDKLKSVIPSPSSSSNHQAYGKGVVFYVKDRKIVGLLMFNLFNRLELARDIIRRKHTVEDLESLVSLFNINEGQ